MKTAVVWFRQDLRLADNPALAAAVEDGHGIVPLYIRDEAHPDCTANTASAWWLHYSLRELHNALESRGSGLILRRDDTLTALLDVARTCGASRVYWNRRYEPGAAGADERIEDGLRMAGLACHTYNATLLFEPGSLMSARGEPYRVFTPFANACARRLLNPSPAPAPVHLPGAAGTRSAGLPVEALRLLPTERPVTGLEENWRPGEHNALEALESFCDRALRDYPDLRDRPDLAGTSRLSPHLHFGEIGPAQVVAAIRRHVASRVRKGLVRAGEAYVRQILWREFAGHLLYHFPHTFERPLDPRFEHFPWAADQETALQRWREGMTGIPIVDAGMRELRHTGWMHNRARMIVASLLTKNLRIPWQEGARWFLENLVDADMANNSLGWQWSAGCGADAAPYFRIFNPVRQAERFDPQGAYVGRWVPEIAGVALPWRHRPWTASVRTLEKGGVTIGRDYPLPVVDLVSSRREALEAWQALRDYHIGGQASGT
jgi:deoxyribodipyrimidine photo-lyase